MRTNDFPNKVRIDMVSLEDDKLLQAYVGNDASLQAHVNIMVLEMEAHLNRLRLKGKSK